MRDHEKKIAAALNFHSVSTKTNNLFILQYKFQWSTSIFKISFILLVVLATQFVFVILCLKKYNIKIPIIRCMVCHKNILLETSFDMQINFHRPILNFYIDKKFVIMKKICNIKMFDCFSFFMKLTLKLT